MWNSPTHALNDIESLAYRKPVPQSERIEPYEFSYSMDTCSEPRQNTLDSCLLDPDLSQPIEGTGRGRGALFNNRMMAHRNDIELAKQLRLATGYGFSNHVLEFSFANSSPANSTTPVAVPPVVAEGCFDDDDDDYENNIHQHSPDKLKEVDNTSVNENGEWVWEKRDANPIAGAFPKKNVALASIARQLKKAETKAALTTEVCNEIPKVKEDWRAEIRAAEEEQKQTSKKNWWRSREDEPLLGDLLIKNNNWSAGMSAVNSTSPDYSSENVQTYGEVSPHDATDKLLSLEEGYRRGRKKKKKHQNVKPMYVPVEGTRNGQRSDIHNTFGNLFSRAIQPLRDQCVSFDTPASFRLSQSEFPRLK